MSYWREWLGLPPRIEDFAHRVRRALRVQGAGDWKYDDSAQVLRGPPGAVIALANRFLQYRDASRRERAALVESFVAQVKSSGEEIPKLWTLARDRLMPVVRRRSDASFHDLYSRLEQGEPMPPAPAVPLAPDLCIRLVCDSDLTMIQVQQEVLDTWGQTPGAALDVALANLRALLKPEWMRMEGGHYQLDSEAGYAESFLLLDKVRAQLPFAGRAVFMVPNRGVLLAADGEDEAACLSMLARARQGLDNDAWAMSADVLMHREDLGWQTATLPEAARHEANELKIIRTARDYDEQQEMLERLFEREGRDVFVAACTLIERDGVLCTLCTWPQGVHSLLPRTDLLATGLCDDDGGMSDSILLRWDDAAAICPGLSAPSELNPPRFELEQAATGAQWAALQAAAAEQIGPRG